MQQSAVDERRPLLSYHHVMSEPAPLLLLSMPQMSDPNFARTVVLLCEYTDRGAFGLVVNRQMEQPAWTVVRTEPPVQVDPEVRLWIGGPVNLQRTWVLTRDVHGPGDEQQEVCPGVILSASRELVLKVLQSPPDELSRIVIGYAGWGPGQLDHEIAASSWLTMPVDPALIFNVPPDQMWEAAIRRFGTDPSAFQASTGVH
jgi:putative transcriptional regulator